MRKDKQKAYNLRKEGLSYGEISQKLTISKSTLSEWFSSVEWSKSIKTKLIKQSKEKAKIHIEILNKKRGLVLQEKYKQAEDEALKELEVLRYNPLFLSGIMLYWGEGDKLNRHAVKFINTDPKMIELFCYFLRNICEVPEEKIKVGILLYENNDKEKCEDFWSEITKIEKSGFHKTILLPSRSEKKRTPFGICLITVSNSFLKKKFLVWLEKLPLELLSKSYYNL